MSTRLELKNRLNRLVDDTVDASSANDWINDRLHDVCDREDWEFLKTSATVTLDGGESYSFSSDFSITDFDKPVKVRDETNNAYYNYRPYAERDEMDVDGQYEYTYDPDKTTLYLGVDNSGATLRMDYKKAVTELSSDSDTPVIPTRFQRVLIVGMAADWYRAENRLQDANFYEREYENMIEKMRDYYSRKATDETIRIKNITEGYTKCQ